MPIRRSFLGTLLVLALSVVSAQAQIARNGVSDGSLSNTGTLSWSHTTGGSNRYLIVGCKVYDAHDISSVTADGVGMTQIRGYVSMLTQEPASSDVLFGLVNPTSGSITIIVTRASANNIACNAVSYEGVKQTGQPDATNEGAAEAAIFTGLTIAVTVVPTGSWLVMNCSGNYNTSNFAGGAGTTMTTENGFLPGIHAMFDSNGTVSTGSQTLECQHPGQAGAAGIIAVLAPVGGDVTPPCQRQLLGVGCDAALLKEKQQ